MKILVFLGLFLTACSAGPHGTRSNNGELGSAKWPQFSSWEKGDDGSRDVAIVIGIEKYTFLPKVSGAIQTANDWERYFRQSRGMRDVFVLTNQNAPIEEIDRFVDNALKSATPGGKLWFVFVGHGAPSADGTDGLLVGMDAQQNMTSIQKRSVSQYALQQKLARGNQEQTIMVVDACFSGRSGEGTALVKGAQPVIALKEMSAMNNVLLFTAAKSDEIAGALPGNDRPAFSYLMLGGLRGWADSDGDQSVTASELSQFATSQMRFVPGRQQTPTLLGNGNVVVGVGAAEQDPGISRLMSGIQPTEQEVAKPNQKTTKTKKKSSALDSLSARGFGFGGLDWSATAKTFKARFGTPAEEAKENARSLKIAYLMTFSKDQVIVLGEFRSDELSKVMIVLDDRDQKYGSTELLDAHTDWNAILEDRLGVGFKRQSGVSLGRTWILDDKTQVLLAKDTDGISIQFFRSGFLEIDPNYLVPNNPGSIGAYVDTAKKNGVPYGAKVRSILKGSPLPGVGIEVGDVIIEMDGIPVKTNVDLTQRLRYLPDGVWVELKIERGTARFKLVPRSWIGNSGKTKSSFPISP